MNTWWQRQPPLQICDDATTTLPGRRPATKDKMMKKMTPARGMDESSQGPKRAVAEAVGCPLGVQPGIHRHWRLLLQVGQLLGYCSYKAMPSTRHFGIQIQCHSSRIGGAGLLKARQEGSLAGPSGHWLLHHINNCTTSWKSGPRNPECCV
jgi:hypothetical protein